MMTDRQKQILEYIRACNEAGDLPPTIREIMDETGITSSSSVSSDLDALQREGYIKRLRDTSRGIRLLEKAQPIKSEYMRLADALQVMQVNIDDLQAEMRRLRQQFILVKKSDLTEEGMADASDAAEAALAAIDAIKVAIGQDEESQG